MRAHDANKAICDRCGRPVLYGEGVYLRGGKQIHKSCYHQRNTQGGRNE